MSMVLQRSETKKTLLHRVRFELIEKDFMLFNLADSRVKFILDSITSSFLRVHAALNVIKPCVLLVKALGNKLHHV